jgi:diacylglycerol kinase family enzyme
MRTKLELQAAIHRDRRAALVVNTRSRRGKRHYRRIREYLDTAGFKLLGCYPTDDPDRLGDNLNAAIGTGPDLLVAGGGDGTISEAARRLAYRDIALGLLPLGTTNNFARTLGIPLQPAAALALLTSGKVADVDLGEVRPTTAGEPQTVPFANLVSLGVSGEVAGHVSHLLKRLIGRAAYPLTALTRLPGHKAFHARITTADGQTRVVRTHQLNIANGSFHAGTPIAGDASADDRLLMAYALGAHGRRHLLAATVMHLLTGHRRTLTDEPFLTTDDLWLHTEPALPLDVDGELCGTTPAHVGLAAQALLVVVDADFPDT